MSKLKLFGLAAFSMLTVLFMSPAANAASPADYGLHEGDLISAASSDDPDIYIINETGYKRLFLNPIIFNFYGHLGGFGNVKTVAPATRDAFKTSTLFRNCETNDPKVYAVEVTGEDTGTFHHVQVDGVLATQQDPDFFKKIFCINNNEYNWYPKNGEPYTSISQIPPYNRNPPASPSPTTTTIPSPTATMPPPPPSGGGTTPPPAPTPAPTPQVRNINIVDFSFSPGTLNVTKGDIVRFTNNDGINHSAVADTGAWATPVISQGQSADIDTSTLPVGTYRYHCGIHNQAMVGTLRVQ